MVATYEGFLLEIGQRLRERAEEAKCKLDLRKAQSTKAVEYEFQSGHVLAYYEVLSTIIGQARAMELPLQILGLEGFDANKLLK